MVKRKTILFRTGLIICILSLTTTVPQKSDIVLNEIVKTNSVDPDINDMINMINESMLREYLEKQVAFGPRPTGSQNCDRVADYLFSEFVNMSLDVRFKSFNFLRCNGRNIIATLNGSDNASDAEFIFCCHYDTWPGSPGANDDASGCAAILAIAKIMSQFSFNHTMRFILFSGHEQGAYGSIDYAQKAYGKDDNIHAVICLGSIGRIAKNATVLQMSKSYRSDWIFYSVQHICEKYTDIFNLTVEPVPVWFADNLPFQRYGFTSTVVWAGPSDIEDHCPEDDIDRINFSYLTNITKLMLITAVDISNKPIDVQVRFVTPKEGRFYISDKICFNVSQKKSIISDFQGMTYLFGKKIIARINITAEEEISNAIYSIDNEIKYTDVVTEPPYEWQIRKWSSLLRYFGRHTMGVTITTVSGKVAYDEMDIFVL